MFGGTELGHNPSTLKTGLHLLSTWHDPTQEKGTGHFSEVNNHIWWQWLRQPQEAQCLSDPHERAIVHILGCALESQGRYKTTVSRKPPQSVGIPIHAKMEWAVSKKNQVKLILRDCFKILKIINSMSGIRYFNN